LTLRGIQCQTKNFQETAWSQTQSIIADGVEIGVLTVYYTEEKPAAHEGPFLKEERRLIRTIAERVAFFITRQNFRQAHERLQSARAGSREGQAVEWGVVLDFLRRTDPDLLRRVTRRLINHLGLLGLPEAEDLLLRFISGREDSAEPPDDNFPTPKSRLEDLMVLSEETFRIASGNLGEEEMVAAIRRWLGEERSGFLIEVLEDQSCTLSEIVEAIGRHQSQIGDTSELSASARNTLNVALVRRLFTEEIDYVTVAKDNVTLEDVADLVKRIVYPRRGHGRLGGKTAGLFLAGQLLRKADSALLRAVKIPRAWYVSTDALLEFLSYNNLHELHFRRYLPIEHVRQEYPHIIHLLKNSHFPPELSHGLALALDDLHFSWRTRATATRAWPRCRTPSPRSTLPSSARTPSSTAPSEA
jgi:hypothetical protein